MAIKPVVLCNVCGALCAPPPISIQDVHICVVLRAQIHVRSLRTSVCLFVCLLACSLVGHEMTICVCVSDDTIRRDFRCCCCCCCCGAHQNHDKANVAPVDKPNEQLLLLVSLVPVTLVRFAKRPLDNDESCFAFDHLVSSGLKLRLSLRLSLRLDLFTGGGK